MRDGEFGVGEGCGVCGMRGFGVGICGFGGRWCETANCSTWNNLKSPGMTHLSEAFLR